MTWPSLWRELQRRRISARAQGVDVLASRISLTQVADENEFYWRISYGPKNYIGRRGGDLIIEVNADDASILRVLHGQ